MRTWYGVGAGRQLSRRREQIANRGGARKEPGILAGKARDLQAQRQAVGRQQRQRQGRNADRYGAGLGWSGEVRQMSAIGT